MFLHDGHEDVIDSYSGNFEFEVLRPVEHLPQVVAMYWSIRKGDDL